MLEPWRFELLAATFVRVLVYRVWPTVIWEILHLGADEVLTNIEP